MSESADWRQMADRVLIAVETSERWPFPLREEQVNKLAELLKQEFIVHMTAIMEKS